MVSRWGWGLAGGLGSQKGARVSGGQGSQRAVGWSQEVGGLEESQIIRISDHGHLDI